MSKPLQMRDYSDRSYSSLLSQVLANAEPNGDRQGRVVRAETTNMIRAMGKKFSKLDEDHSKLSRFSRLQGEQLETVMRELRGMILGLERDGAAASPVAEAPVEAAAEEEGEEMEEVPRHEGLYFDGEGNVYNLDGEYMGTYSEERGFVSEPQGDEWLLQRLRELPHRLEAKSHELDNTKKELEDQRKEIARLTLELERADVEKKLLRQRLGSYW